MYRTSPVRCIFFVHFFKKTAKKIYFIVIFHRHLFVTPHALRRGDFYYELFRMCTWITQCMRCDGWEPAFFRPSGEIFREKIRSRVRTECARIHMRPRAGTEGAGGAKRGRLRLCCRAVRVSIVESRTAGAEQRPRQKRDPETVFLGVSRGVF